MFLLLLLIYWTDGLSSHIHPYRRKKVARPLCKMRSKKCMAHYRTGVTIHKSRLLRLLFTSFKPYLYIHLLLQGLNQQILNKTMFEEEYLLKMIRRSDDMF